MSASPKTQPGSEADVCELETPGPWLRPQAVWSLTLRPPPCQRSRASDVASMHPVFVLLWDRPGGKIIKSDPAPQSCAIVGLAGH